MRCVSCNCNLNNYESTRKDLHGKYLDMCNSCYRLIRDDLPTIAREDLSPSEEVEPENPTNPEWDELKLD